MSNSAGTEITMQSRDVEKSLSFLWGAARKAARPNKTTSAPKVTQVVAGEAVPTKAVYTKSATARANTARARGWRIGTLYSVKANLF